MKRSRQIALLLPAVVLTACDEVPPAPQHYATQQECDQQSDDHCRSVGSGGHSVVYIAPGVHPVDTVYGGTNRMLASRAVRGGFGVTGRAFTVAA